MADNASPVWTVILAGGQGTRFWPMSRGDYPKQFLSIESSGKSLLQMTAERARSVSGDDRVLIVTNALHEAHVREQVPSAHVISEPIPKNTAAALAFAAAYVASRDGEATVLVCLPADHAVANSDNLQRSLQESVNMAQTGDYLVTLGITPTRPDTAYGYIQRGGSLGERSYRVARFYEKPNADRARTYIESGDYYWNSGMFVWTVASFRAALERHMPRLCVALGQMEKIFQQSEIGAEQFRTLFESLENISIDFGLMEHASNCIMVAAYPYGWNDVGSWDAWAEHFEHDAHGNVCRGDTLALETHDSILYSGERFVAALGVRDLVIIDSGDAVLVCPRDRVQDVRKIVDELKKQGRDALVSTRKVGST